MKILQLITHLEIGGAQKATLYLSSYLKSQGHYVILSSGPKGLLAEDARKIMGWNFKIFRFLIREINPIFDLIAFFTLFIYIREQNFDIVHTHISKAGFLGRWAAFFAGVKSVHTVHGFAFHDYQNPVVKWLYIILEKFTARITSRIIAVSEKVRDKGLKYGISNNNKYKVVYELVQLPPVRVISLKNTSPQVIGMIAALKPQKNPCDFIKLAGMVSCRYPRLQFHIVGNGKLGKKIKKMVSRLGIENRVKFWGWQREGWKFMINFDIMVLTSLFEGQPHVVIEAMALGIPVVAYGVDGVNDIIKDGMNGFTVSPRNLSELRRKVELLLNDSSLREKISANAYNWVRKEKKLDCIYNSGRIEKIYMEVKNE